MIEPVPPADRLAETLMLCLDDQEGFVELVSANGQPLLTMPAAELRNLLLERQGLLLIREGEFLGVPPAQN